MKVAMVMPMSPESAIADVMIQAVPNLTGQWDVEVWCPSEADYRSCPVLLRPYETADADVLGALAAYDLVVYVLGDSPRHSRILPLAQALPGLVVVHDASLTNLVRHAAIERGEMEELARAVAPDIGVELAETLRTWAPPRSAAGWLQFCADVPLSDVALRGSLGVVVHSAWHARRVEALTLGDVTVAPLPVPSTRIGFDENDSESSSLLLGALPDDDILLVTVGTANANRQIDLLLRAVAGDEMLARRVHLWAVGPATGEVHSDLLRLARTLGLDERFAVTGRVSDALLHQILSRADIAAALRDPVLEGQSASLLTQLLSGIPVVVFDHAHYCELPDDVAVKVDPDDGDVGIRDALRLLVDDEAGRARRGGRARDYVLGSRSGAAYATALIEAGERALAARPFAYLAGDVNVSLRRLDLHREPAVVDAITNISFELFDLD